MNYHADLGHYIGHTLSVQAKFGTNRIRHVKYAFLRPSRYFNTRDLDDARVTACICARVYVEIRSFGKNIPFT